MPEDLVAAAGDRLLPCGRHAEKHVPHRVLSGQLPGASDVEGA